MAALQQRRVRVTYDVVVDFEMPGTEQALADGLLGDQAAVNLALGLIGDVAMDYYYPKDVVIPDEPSAYGPEGEATEMLGGGGVTYDLVRRGLASLEIQDASIIG